MFVYENNIGYLVEGAFMFTASTKITITTNWTTIQDLGISIKRNAYFMAHSYEAEATYFGRITTDGLLQVALTSGSSIEVLQVYMSGSVYCEKD